MLFEKSWICVADVVCRFALHAPVLSVSDLRWLKFGVIVGILDWRFTNENFQNWSLVTFRSHQMDEERKCNRRLVLFVPISFTKKMSNFQFLLFSFLNLKSRIATITPYFNHLRSHDETITTWKMKACTTSTAQIQYPAPL